MAARVGECGAGHQRVVQLALENLPTLIETGKTWSYSVRATNQGSAPVIGDKLFETRSIGNQNLLTSIANQVTIPAGGESSLPNQSPGQRDARGRAFNRDKDERKDWEFPVVEIRLHTLANPGGGQSPGRPLRCARFRTARSELGPQPYPQEHIRNRNQLIGGNDHRGRRPAANTACRPNPSPERRGKLWTAAASGRHHRRPASGDLGRFQLAKWTVSSVTAIKTIRVSADLAIDFQTPSSPQVNTAWSYSLTLRNVGRSPLAIGSLKQRLSSADFATTAFTEIPLATPIHLNQGTSATVAPVTGIPVPRPTVSSPTHKVSVEIQPTYSRGGETRSWEPQTKSEEIDYVQGGPLQ